MGMEHGAGKTPGHRGTRMNRISLLTQWEGFFVEQPELHMSDRNFVHLSHLKH